MTSFIPRYFSTMVGNFAMILAATGCTTRTIQPEDSIPESSEATPSQVTYYGNVEPLMRQRCLGCHSETGVSFSFEDPEAVKGFGPAIVSAVSSRRMPPWLAAPGHQVYKDDYTLSEKQISLFQKWQANGFPLGEKTLAKNSILDKQVNAFTSDLTLEVFNQRYPEYLPKQDQRDDYRCFLMEWPEERDVYVTGFQADPGNSKVSHHLVLFVAEPEIAETLKKLDAEEPGRGYQCFGGGLPDRVAMPKVRKRLEKKRPGLLETLNAKTYWLAHWAPGMEEGYRFPKDTGIKVRKGSLLVIQKHYYSAFAPGETDTDSRMKFMLKDKVVKPSYYIPITHKPWLTARKNKSMVIPTSESKTFHVDQTLEQIYQSAVEKLGDTKTKLKTLEIHSANIHMHAYGASGKVALHSPQQGAETLLEIPDWDIAWQRDFQLNEPKLFSIDRDLKDTKLSLTCEFYNSTSQPVYGGFSSDEEMCFNFMYVSLAP